MAEMTLSQLTEQVQRLTQRVAALERELAIARPPAEPVQEQVSAPPLPVEPPPFLQEGPQPPIAASERMPEAISPEVPPADFESHVGLRLLNRVGAVTLILGIAFFFRYAVENNWINETTRVLLGVLTGLLLLAGGEWAFRREQKVFAQGITGTGSAALFFSVYAGFAAYHLFPLAAAFAFMAAIATTTAYLALRYNSQAIAILALLGGLLAPNEIQAKLLGPYYVPIYVALFDAGLLYVTRRRAWRITEVAALAATFLLTTQFDDAPLRALLPVYYLIFATRPSLFIFVAIHLIILLEESYVPGGFWERAGGLFGISALGLIILQWRRWFSLTSILLTAAGLAWFAIENISESSLESLWVIGGLYTLFLGFTVWFISETSRDVTNRGEAERHPRRNSFEAAALVATPGFLILAVHSNLKGHYHSGFALLALVLASFYGALAYWWRQTAALQLFSTLSAAIATALLALAVPIEFGAFRVTMVWAWQGAALVWIASRWKPNPADGFANTQVIGVALLGVASILFFSNDLAMYRDPETHAALANARFGTALVLATAWFCSSIWSRATRFPAWFPGLLGHSVLLAGLAHEVFDWAATHHPNNQASAESVGISLVFAAYAVLLVLLGTRLRSVESRYVGLSLMALVVVKLYAYDMWQMEFVFRFVAFAALGALLLVMSFVYSRYRNVIASWLSRDAPPPATLHAASEAHPPPQPE